MADKQDRINELTAKLVEATSEHEIEQINRKLQILQNLKAE